MQNLDNSKQEPVLHQILQPVMLKRTTSRWEIKIQIPDWDTEYSAIAGAG